MQINWQKFWFNPGKNFSPGMFFVSGAVSGWLFWVVMGRHLPGFFWALACTVGVLVWLFNSRVAND